MGGVYRCKITEASTTIVLGMVTGVAAYVESSMTKIDLPLHREQQIL